MKRKQRLRRSTILLSVCMALISGAPALAQSVDLSKAYGTTVGCQNRAGQKVESEDMLLLTDASIVTSTSTCTFVEKLTAPDGTVVATALCTIEGEEGRSIAQFSIVPAKGNPANLMIYDEYGSGYDEVAPCP